MLKYIHNNAIDNELIIDAVVLTKNISNSSVHHLHFHPLTRGNFIFPRASDILNSSYTSYANKIRLKCSSVATTIKYKFF